MNGITYMHWFTTVVVVVIVVAGGDGAVVTVFFLRVRAYQPHHES